MSEWGQSDIFIIFVVVLLLIVVVLIAAYFILKRHSIYRKPEELAGVEISFPDTTDQPKFVMKIITEQKNASEMVQIVMRQIYSTKTHGPVASVTPAFGPLTPAVASASQDQPRAYRLFSSRLKKDDFTPDEGPSTLLNVPAKNPNILRVSAMVSKGNVPD